MNEPYVAVTVFETRDRKQHRDERYAADWAQWLDDLDAANAMFQSGASVLDSLHRAYAATPYRFNSNSWEVLGRITKDTKLIISHWQCQDNPCYLVEEIRPSGALRVGGVGGWSGYYANDVSPGDLARYAAKTLGIKATEQRT